MLVPKGVKVGVNTVNGAVSVDGATSDVDAATVNGDVEVATTGGRVNASNVNGGVRARLGELDPDGRMDFTTVNGNVSVEFGGDSGADVDLETVNGIAEHELRDDDQRPVGSEASAGPHRASPAGPGSAWRRSTETSSCGSAIATASANVRRS